MYSFETPKEAIVRLHNEGHGPRRIRALVRCGHERIKRTINYFKEKGEIPTATKIGRPAKSTHEVLTEITNYTIENHSISGFDISENLKKIKIL